MGLACASLLPAENKGFLPQRFGGWQKAAGARVSSEAAIADAANAALLEEYGFQEFEAATYTRDARSMKVKAARFADATGAYGAFTFYKQPQMETERIGYQGASDGVHVFFYSANVLVDVWLDRVTATSAAELRELNQALPLPAANASALPVLPRYLPRPGYVKNSARFVMGPMGLEKIGAPISPLLVDFKTGAEVVTAQYVTSRGSATLTLVSYPTPQIAADRLRRIGAAPPGEESAHPLAARRTGPLLVLVSGDLSTSEAQSLLGSVNYDADVTWNEQTSISKRDNIGNLIVNVFYLIGIIVAFATVVGVAFGGLRIVAKRLFPDKVFDRSQDVEIIRLNLGAGGR